MSETMNPTSAMAPARGALEGGTPVTVRGASLRQSLSESLGLLRCQFGSVVVAAVAGEEGSLVCNSTRGESARNER